MSTIFTDKRQYFTSLPVSFLNVDNSYQKPLSNSHVKKITKNYDPMGIGQIHVSKRDDGTYWVFDGQHRTASHRELDIKEIDCIVYEGLTIEEEAKGYIHYNNTMKQSQLQKFKAEMLVGEREAVEINSIVKSVDLGIDFSGSGEPIKAVGALRKIYNKYGKDDLREVLYILSESFGSGKQAYQAFVIEGVHKFLIDYKKHDNFNQSWLIGRFEKFGLPNLIRRTNEFYSVHRGSKKDAVALASVQIFNHGKRKENKL